MTPKKSSSELALRQRNTALEKEAEALTAERDESKGALAAIKLQVTEDRKKLTEVKRSKADASALAAELEGSLADAKKQTEQAQRSQRAAELEVLPGSSRAKHGISLLLCPYLR